MFERTVRKILSDFNIVGTELDDEKIPKGTCMATVIDIDQLELYTGT